MADFDRLERECDYATKLAVTGWVFKNILAHAKEGGSYRGLIYERLGFGPDAYAYLHESGGLEISNEFDVPHANAVRRLVKQHKITVLKDVLGLCDVAGCFEDGVCSWPFEKGYRRTCSDHKELNKK